MRPDSALRGCRMGSSEDRPRRERAPFKELPMGTREPRWGAGGAPVAGLAKGREPPREWTRDPDPQRARAPTG